MKGRFVPFAIAAVVAAIDQLLKAMVVTRFAVGESVTLVPGILYLSRVHNTGLAFGLFGGRNQFLAFLAGIVALGVGWSLWRESFPGRWGRLGGALVLGGAMGNLVDRLARGYVVDYVDFRFFPAFNVADAAVVVGAVVVALAFLWRKR